MTVRISLQVQPERLALSAAEQAAAVQQDLANGAACTDAQQSPAGQRCVFEDALLTAEVLRLLGERHPQQPLFLFWA